MGFVNLAISERCTDRNLELLPKLVLAGSWRGVSAYYLPFLAGG